MENIIINMWIPKLFSSFIELKVNTNKKYWESLTLANLQSKMYFQFKEFILLNEVTLNGDNISIDCKQINIALSMNNNTIDLVNNLIKSWFYE